MNVNLGRSLAPRCRINDPPEDGELVEPRVGLVGGALGSYGSLTANPRGPVLFCSAAVPLEGREWQVCAPHVAVVVVLVAPAVLGVRLASPRRTLVPVPLPRPGSLAAGPLRWVETSRKRRAPRGRPRRPRPTRQPPTGPDRHRHATRDANRGAREVSEGGGRDRRKFRRGRERRSLE